MTNHVTLVVGGALLLLGHISIRLQYRYHTRLCQSPRYDSYGIKAVHLSTGSLALRRLIGGKAQCPKEPRKVSPVYLTSSNPTQKSASAQDNQNLPAQLLLPSRFILEKFPTASRAPLRHHISNQKQNSATSSLKLARMPTNNTGSLENRFMIFRDYEPETDKLKPTADNLKESAKAFGVTIKDKAVSKDTKDVPKK